MSAHKPGRDNKIISASEIGQYHFCSIAWYLQKQGYQPQSPLLESGKKKHVEHGNVIDKVEKLSKRSKVVAITGYLLLALAIFLLFFEVIL